MTYFTGFLALIGTLIGNKEALTSIQKWNLFFDNWYRWETVFLSITSVCAGITLLLGLVLIAFSLSRKRKSGTGLALGSYTLVTGIVFLALPFFELLTRWLVGNMANAFSPTAGIVDSFAFWASALAILALGAG